MAGEAMIALAAAMLVGQAPAAETPQQRGPDVVVTARPKSSVEEVRRQVRAITQRSGDQVARFHEPVCAGAIGLPQPYAGRVIARITEDAQAAGIATDKPGCRPNVTLVIVDDGKLLLTELRRQKPALFAAMPPREVQRALDETGPVRTITLTQLKSRDGNTLSNDYTQGNTGMAGGAATLLVNSASIIHLATRQDITGSLVIVDTAATLGKTLNQLADYTAMRALARTNASADAGDDTILSLFHTTAAPRALTVFDTAFLKALYRGPATASLQGKLTQMTRDIAEGQQ